MFFVDRRLGGVLRLHYSQPRGGPVRVNDDMLHSVCYVCSRSPGTGKYTPEGTAFLVLFPDEEWGEYYMVTAAHVIDAARSGDGSVYLRVNTADGGVTHMSVPAQWWTPDDEGVDIAALPFPGNRALHMACVVPQLLATDEVIAQYDIGVGDPLDIIGLFSYVQGRDRNRPIVRTGTIAAMPDEPFIASEGAPPAWVYLAEMRSHSGLSGSPVSVLLGYDRDADGNRVRTGAGFLLGLIRGHWELPDAAYNSVQRDRDGTLNTGIALITPIQEVAKLLMTDQAKAHRAGLAAERTRTGARVAPDSVNTPRPARGREPERLKIDATFQDAARKLARTPRPEGGWPKRDG